jgi:hypothetical protein
MTEPADQLPDWVVAELKRTSDPDPDARAGIMHRIRRLAGPGHWRSRKLGWSYRPGPRGALVPGAGLTLAFGLAGLLATAAIDTGDGSGRAGSDSVATRLMCDSMRALRDSLGRGDSVGMAPLPAFCDTAIRRDTVHG